MRIPLLFNPASGTSRKDPDALLARLPAEHRERIQMVPFGPPYDFAPWIAQAVAAGGPLLVWGGDGTIHHAGRALVAAGCPVALGAIPGGSGNGLVRGLRTPLEPAGAVRRLLEGRELRMDLPRLDGLPFLNLCGTGFEAAVAHAFDADAKGRGFWGYAQLGLALWRSHPTTALRWEANVPPQPAPEGRRSKLAQAWAGPDQPLPDAAWSLCLANLPQYGSGLWIAPGADPTSGALQWATLRHPGLLDLLTGLPPLFREGGRSSLRQEGRLLQATLHLPQALPWHADGEPLPPRDRAELTVEPRAFPMQVTGACPWR
jgi:diacylglycerol kinase family enzyme